MLAVGDKHPREWRTGELQLLRQLSERIFPRIERARAETALRESEALYHSLFEMMDEGFAVGEIIRDAGGRAVDYKILELNRAYESQTGRARRRRDRPAHARAGAAHGSNVAARVRARRRHRPAGALRATDPGDGPLVPRAGVRARRRSIRDPVRRHHDPEAGRGGAEARPRRRGPPARGRERGQPRQGRIHGAARARAAQSADADPGDAGPDAPAGQEGLRARSAR